MGKLEEENKILIKRTELQKAILSTIAVTGILAIGLLAPNVIIALKKLNLLPHRRTREVVASVANRLRKKGLLRFTNGHYELTKFGHEVLRRWEIMNYRLEKPKKWDKKWRLIIFDIPEKKRKVRDTVRHILLQTGLLRLQDSVWVYPYDCEDVIGILKNEFNIGRDMLYLIVDQIENDRHLRKAFDLQQ